METQALLGTQNISSSLSGTKMAKVPYLKPHYFNLQRHFPLRPQSENTSLYLHKDLSEEVSLTVSCYFVLVSISNQHSLSGQHLVQQRGRVKIKGLLFKQTLGFCGESDAGIGNGSGRCWSFVRGFTFHRKPTV